MRAAIGGPCDEGVVRCADQAAPELAAKQGAWVLAAAVLASSMAFIDATVVNVALPVLQERLGASVSGAQWVVEAYLLLLSSLLLVGGALGDRFGRRRVFLAGVGIFAVASAACGLARSVSELVAARAAQGVGGALLVPGSLALISSAFPAGRRGRAIGTWSGLTSVAAAVGPVLGGWLVQTVSWRAAFFLNLPFAAVVTLIAIQRVPESRDPQAPPLDWAGAALATVGLGGMVFGLVESTSLGWRDARVAGSLVGGVLALAGFLVVERRSAHPMVPPALFRSQAFVGANLLTLFLYAALSGTLLFLSFDLIQAQGFSPAQAGASLIPFVVISFALSRWSGGLLDRVGPRLPLTIGPAVAGLGFALLAVPGLGADYWTGFFPGVCLLGFGMSITVAPLTTTVMNAVDPRQAGLASGVNNAVARVGGLAAIALLGIAVIGSYNRALDRELSATGLSAVSLEMPRAERAKLGSARPPPGLAEADAERVRRAIALALVSSFRFVALASAALALLAAASAAWLIDGPKGRRHAFARTAAISPGAPARIDTRGSGRCGTP